LAPFSNVRVQKVFALLDEIMKHEYAWVFNTPVDTAVSIFNTMKN
jgi:hypothetical protein